MHAGNWVGIHWPREYGGRGASLLRQLVYAEEMGRANAPAPINPIGIMMVGPTLMQWGTEAQKRRFIPKMLSADEIWCQGYSEPNAGSDLAALQTRAVADGDDYVVNGQKVWTSLAHRAHWCILLCRTDPSARKHLGISYLLVDMRSPGITVRPLVQITGDAEFNEVFFEDVRVPKENLVGRENEGWQVAMTDVDVRARRSRRRVPVRPVDPRAGDARRAPRAQRPARDRRRVRTRAPRAPRDRGRGAAVHAVPPGNPPHPRRGSGPGGVGRQAVRHRAQPPDRRLRERDPRARRPRSNAAAAQATTPPNGFAASSPSAPSPSAAAPPRSSATSSASASSSCRAGDGRTSTLARRSRARERPGFTSGRDAHRSTARPARRAHGGVIN